MPVIDGRPVSELYAGYTAWYQAVNMELVAQHNVEAAAKAVHDALYRVLATDGNANHYNLPKLNDELNIALAGAAMVRKWRQSEEAENG
jgi:hypothetical protein